MAHRRPPAVRHPARPAAHRVPAVQRQVPPAHRLLASGTSGWDPNQARYGTATSLAGRWSATRAVGNGTTFDSQPTFILPIEGSETTSYLYLGDRWQDPTWFSS